MASRVLAGLTRVTTLMRKDEWMAEKDVLLRHLNEAFDHKSWHGTNLLGSIRRVNPEQASWRPSPARHNIWENIVHAAYWKYSVYRSLTGQPRGSFPLEGSNWFVRPLNESEAALKADVALLRDFHAKLLDAVRHFDSRRLLENPAGSKFTYQSLILGAGAHDLYHAGQIQLLKRLQQKS
jgi:hypothetical protein